MLRGIWHLHWAQQGTALIPRFLPIITIPPRLARIAIMKTRCAVPSKAIIRIIQNFLPHLAFVRSKLIGPILQKLLKAWLSLTPSGSSKITLILYPKLIRIDFRFSSPPLLNKGFKFIWD
ncbi:MAG TPA: hypothetical protein DF383_12140 [Deltaproteobacteria bacterium]|nr:hypothetical protein [Deltaproteobacteria bacterium]